MKTAISNRAEAADAPRVHSIAARLPSIAFALGVSACAVFAAANGPTLWTGAEQRKIEQVQQENKLFCEKFRMPSGGESFATCVGLLSEIRKLHGERLAAEAAGVL